MGVFPATDTGMVTTPIPVATEPLPPVVRTLWRVSAAGSSALAVVAGAVAAVVAGEPLVFLAGAGAGLLVLGVGWPMADLRYRAWRWGLDDRWVESHSGVIIRTTQVVPRSRVQTLTTTTGPLDRRLGLTTVVIHTAGTHTPNLAIPHLGPEAVDLLRRVLAG